MCIEMTRKYNYGNITISRNTKKGYSELIEEHEELKKYISRVLFVLGCSELPKGTRLSYEEIEAISKLQNFIGEEIVDLEKIKEDC